MINLTSGNNVSRTWLKIINGIDVFCTHCISHASDTLELIPESKIFKNLSWTIFYQDCFPFSSFIRIATVAIRLSTIPSTSYLPCLFPFSISFVLSRLKQPGNYSPRIVTTEKTILLLVRRRRHDKFDERPNRHGLDLILDTIVIFESNAAVTIRETRMPCFKMFGTRPISVHDEYCMGLYRKFFLVFIDR